jgi:hypothetical protein
LNYSLALLARYIAATPVLVLNGLLYLFYALIDHLWLWVILACGMIVLFVFDLASVGLISSAPSRIGGRPAPIVNTGWNVWVFTLITLVVTVIAVLLYASPIPFIYAAMWAGAVAILFLLPAEREPILVRVKGFLLGYGIAIIAFRFLLLQTQDATPEDWAAMLGSVGAARDMIARNRDTVTTLGMLGVWWGIPMVYFSYLGQRLLNNPQSIFHSRKSTEQIIQDLRHRR